MPWRLLAGILLFVAGRVTLAQRAGNESICDYYASQRYGENNVTTQLQLVESIVTFAYAGGAGIPNAPINSTGIFNQGTLGGLHVYLRPWFDGSKATTNLNDQPVGINWLDGGGTEPLMAFLNGSTQTVQMNNSTNQYRLFTHWFTAFGFVYGCSQVKKFPQTADAGAPLSMPYIHKYMNLNQSDIGYFIDQLTVASKFFGFSDEDAQTLETSMNAKYNVRCAPPVNGQLYSICLADECPLAQPQPDCDAYQHLAPGGAGNNTGGGTATSSSGAPTSTSSSSTISTSPTSPAATSAAAQSSPPLSAGAIAGISIGGAAVLLLAIGLWLFFRRQSAKKHLVPVPVPSGGYGSPAHAPYTYYSPHSHTSYQPGPHESYIDPNGLPGFWVPKPTEMSQTAQEMGQPGQVSAAEIAEMESPQYPPSTEQYQSMQPQSPRNEGYAHSSLSREHPQSPRPRD